MTQTPLLTRAVSDPCTPLRILASCADGPGIVAEVSSSFAAIGANIRESSQFTTGPSDGRLFLRIVVDMPLSAVGKANEAMRRIATQFAMDYRLWPEDQRKRMVVLCSTADHCLLELLWRSQTGDLPVDIPLVISNHRVLESAVAQFDVPFVHVPAVSGDRAHSEKAILDLIQQSGADFVALARYMQILTDQFLNDASVPIINIHHSLLPAFVGAQPYKRAYERGVKIIGATAHYATPELDAGPIIAQDVDHVGHNEDVPALQRRGKNIESTVLARAVGLHIQDRVQVHENRTIIHA